MKRIVVLTGAGISAESGLKTFRDGDGLWEGHNIEDVATPEAWIKNPELVQNFYNERRKAVLEAKPNEGHMALARLQEKYDVLIITQNVDDLHERAGSKNVLHLHGIITKSQSDVDPNKTYPIEGWKIKPADLCEYGKPLRPHVVWFGEEVPNLPLAAKLCGMADIFAVIGTKLAVYPAAGLVDYVPENSIKYVIDPDIPQLRNPKQFQQIQQPASLGVPIMVKALMRMA